MININELRQLVQAATPGPWINHGRQPNVAGLPHSAVGAKTLIARVYSEAYGDVEQETANASFIAAANPAAINELLDRLEAAESECLEQARLNGMGASREAALLAKLEAAENDAAHQKALAASALRVAEGWKRKCGELRAKIKQMEEQEPVGRALLCVRCSTPFDGEYYCPACGHHTATEETVYALPGAQTQPAPSVPEGWEKELFCIQHAMAMNNWNWDSDASNDMKRAAYAAVVKLLAAAPEAKP